MKLRYLGGSDERILSTHDLALLGVEHDGLWWPSGHRVIDVDDEIGEALIERLPREFKEEVLVDPSATKADLLAQAEALGIEVHSGATKAEISELIEQHSLDESSGSVAEGSQPAAG